MRSQLRLFSVIAAMIFPVAIWANVIVKGHITYKNGQPASYYILFDATADSGTIACPLIHYIHTNQNGIYQDTLVCNSAIKYVRVWMNDCDSQSRKIAVPSAGLVEANFIVCNSVVPVYCHADFTSYTISGSVNTVHFHSETSYTGLGDSIISHKWVYGDGDSTSGNNIAPDHRYQNPGNYIVCLYIKTKKGCESQICKAINVRQLAGTCHAKFSFYEMLPEPSTTAYTLRYQNTSTAAINDSLISGIWDFGDGTILKGNVANATHTYTVTGSYRVSLIILSKGGCADTTYQIITTPPLKCFAHFNYTRGADSSFHFNAQPSTVVAGDHITKYFWTFGDGSSATTQDPIHIYAKPGYYQVCLTIISASGCKDSTCNYNIRVAPQPLPTCHAQFTYLPTTGTSPNVTGYIHFNGAPSTTTVGDTIVQYHWTFGDGGTANTKDPYHSYTKAGKYQVCLFVLSKHGCTDSTCTSILITTPTEIICSANFVFANTRLTGDFNSSKITLFSNDSIISRNWAFGDGQILTGNVISPLHHYNQTGDYRVCLKVATRSGCASEFCQTVHIAGDSINTNPDFIKIISVYPNPATTQFSSIIYSRYSNVDAILAIYDVYGTLKWSSKKVLLQGNNTLFIPVSQLLSGPYILKVITNYGVDSRQFFKL